MPTAANSISSRSIRASRSSTPSPKSSRGLDIVKAQIRIAEGGRIGDGRDGGYETGIPPQDADRALSGHALQCRITTENPENNFIPDYGRIIAYRGAFGFGIRIDGGTAYSGAVVTR